MPLADCVLIVEDEFIIAETFTLVLEDGGFTICGVADTAAKAVSMAATYQPRVVLMDVRLKGQGDGIEAASVIRETVGSSIVFVTGSREPETIRRIEQSGAYANLAKPISAARLTATVQNAWNQVA